MFGYIQPLKDELKICEYNTYKSVYCSLCKNLGKSYGAPARMILSYDYTFFAMLGIGLGNTVPGYYNARCVVNPFKKCGFCKNNGEIFNLTSAVSVILFYYKLLDNIYDSGFIFKLKYLALMPFASFWRKKAAKVYPDIDKQAENMILNQQSAEKNGCSVDEAAHPTAEFMSFIAQKLTADQSEKAVLKAFGYHLGRWIYFMDAQDDLIKDIKSGNFNPVFAKFKCDKTILTQPEKLKEIKEYTNGLLNMSISDIIFNYEQLNVKYYDEILQNILRLGTRNLQIKAFDIKENQL